MDPQTFLLFTTVLVAPTFFVLWVLERRKRIEVAQAVQVLEQRTLLEQERLVARSRR